MARLTEKLPDGTCQIPASILYLTNGMQSVIRKLADYEDKMEQGLLVELPCEIGSTVYVISMCGNVKTYWTEILKPQPDIIARLN